MITNFELHTQPLTDAEKALAEKMCANFKKRYYCAQLAIPERTITSTMKERGYDISPSKVRKLVNYMRQNGHPILANNKGYYYSSNRNEIAQNIESLKQRAAAIQAAAKGLESVLNRRQTTINI